MRKDAAALHVPLPPDPELVRRKLLELVEANQAFDATLRVVVVRNTGGMWEGPDMGRASDLIALTSATKEWGSGVRLCYTPHARYAAGEFAGAKILSWAMNLTWLEAAQTRGFDETILLNERDEVAECTSANIFAAEGESGVDPAAQFGLPAGRHARTAAARDPACRVTSLRRERWRRPIWSAPRRSSLLPPREACFRWSRLKAVRCGIPGRPALPCVTRSTRTSTLTSPVIRKRPPRGDDAEYAVVRNLAGGAKKIGSK